MTVELYGSKDHSCLMFTDLLEDDGDAIQANQMVIINGDEAAIIDPGGPLVYNSLYMELSKYVAPQKLTYLIASHADPDVLTSLDRWLTTTSAKLVISRIWERFVPHLAKSGKTKGRVISVPDQGGLLPLGSSRLHILPAHFLHSEGNFNFYDPISRILFTGDLAVSLSSGTQAQQPVTDLAAQIPLMESYHRRYMGSNKILRLWVEMVRGLSINMIVPQHGAPIKGKQAINDLLDWLQELSCGMDLMGQNHYQLPSEKIDPGLAR